MQPDPETEKRIDHLANVGHMLDEVSNDNSEETYFLAKSSLDAFASGLRELKLKPKTKEGMDKLINYLATKIEKRKRQAGGEFSND